MQQEGKFAAVTRIAIQSTREELLERGHDHECDLVEAAIRRWIIQRGRVEVEPDTDIGSVTAKSLRQRTEAIKNVTAVSLFQHAEQVPETHQWLVLYYLYQNLTDSWERTGFHREIEQFIDQFVPAGNTHPGISPVSAILLTMLRKLRHEVSIERGTYCANVFDVLTSAHNVTTLSRHSIAAAEDAIATAENPHADDFSNVCRWIHEVAEISEAYAKGLTSLGIAFREWWDDQKQWLDTSNKAIEEAKILERVIYEDEYASELRAHRLSLERLTSADTKNTAAAGRILIYALYTVGVENLNVREIDHEKILKTWKNTGAERKPSAYYRPVLTDIWDQSWLEQIMEYDLGEIRISVSPFTDQSNKSPETIALRVLLRLQEFGIACVRFVGSTRDVGPMELNALRRRLSPYCTPHDNRLDDVAISVLQSFCDAVRSTHDKLKNRLSPTNADDLHFQFIGSVREHGALTSEKTERTRYERLIRELLLSPIDPTVTSIADWSLKFSEGAHHENHTITRQYPGGVTFSYATNNALIIATNLPSFGADEFDELAEALTFLPAVKGRWIRSLTRAIDHARKSIDATSDGHFSQVTNKQLTEAALSLQRLASDIAFEIGYLREGAWAANPITQVMVRDFVEQSSLAVTIVEVDRRLDQARETNNLLERIATARNAERKDFAELYLNGFVALISLFSVGALIDFLQIKLAFETKIIILSLAAILFFTPLLFILGRRGWSSWIKDIG